MIEYVLHYEDGEEISGVADTVEEVEHKFLAGKKIPIWATASKKDFSCVYSWEWQFIDEDKEIEEFVRIPVVESDSCCLF